MNGWLQALGHEERGMTERVSVIMPAYNAADMIEEGMRSVLAQSHEDFELLVVDDGSEDGTRDIVLRAARSDSRIRLIACGCNGGPGAARNRGFDEASGRWLALVDADDLVEPDHLESLLKAARLHGCDVVAGNQRVRTWPLEADLGLAFRELTSPSELTIEALLHSGLRGGSLSYGFLQPLFLRDFIALHELRYTADFVGEDFLFYFECLRRSARWLLVPGASYIYRRHAGSVTMARKNNYRTLAAATEQLIEECRSDGRLDLLGLLEERKKQLDRHSAYAETVALLRQGRFLRAAARIVAKPWIGARLFGSGVGRRRRGPGSASRLLP